MDCSVCTDKETEENRIVKCVTCGTKVHMMCYGIPEFSEEWKCSPCSKGIFNCVCKLCVQLGGAMKQTVCKKWVHVLCALFTDGVIFVDDYQMEPVDISHLSNSKRNKTCAFCEQSNGFCVLCSNSKCKNRLHITCAKQSECLKEINSKDQTIKFRAYCLEHKPIEKSGRRISAKFVRGISVKKGKNEKKQQQEKSAQLNANWITQKDNDETTVIDEKIDENTVAKNLEIDSANAIDVKKKKKRSKENKNAQDEERIEEVSIQKAKKKKRSKQDKNSQDEDNIEEVSVQKEKKKKPNSHEIFTDVKDESLCWDFNGIQRQSYSGASFVEHLNVDLSDKENVVLEDHICLKDSQIFKYKDKIKKLKDKNQRLEELNMNLQDQLLRFKQPTSLSWGAEPMANQEVLKNLANKVAPKLSDDKTDFIYPNGTKASAKLMNKLASIPNDFSFDRPYINALFNIVFPEKYIKKQLKKKMSREEILNKFRDSCRHETMKGLYDYRVIRNGQGDVKARLQLFKVGFRQKFNNWFNVNLSKYSHSG